MANLIGHHSENMFWQVQETPTTISDVMQLYQAVIEDEEVEENLVRVQKCFKSNNESASKNE